MWGLPLVVASGDHSSSQCTGLSLSRPLLLQSTGSRRAGSVVVAHGPSCSASCGIFPDQGSNPCPLHWQADSQPLRHQGSPCILFISSWSLLFPSFCWISALFFLLFLISLDVRLGYLFEIFLVSWGRPVLLWTSILELLLLHQCHVESEAKEKKNQ